jgi:MATE family multidrug resistance protein
MNKSMNDFTNDFTNNFTKKSPIQSMAKSKPKFNKSMIKPQEVRSILIVALPLMAAFLAQKGMQFIDAFMLGWLGSYALAAAALATSIYFTTLVFCMGVLSAVGVFIVRAKGAADEADITKSLLHGICIALCLSLPCMVLIWFAPYFLTAIGEDPLVVKNVIVFLHGLVWGFPGYLLFIVMREFISAFALTRVVMFVTLSSIPLTFIANYLLMYGAYGFPKLGIAGIAYAGSFIMWFMFLCLFLYGKQHRDLKRYFNFEGFKLDAAKIMDLLYIGIPSGLLFILEAGMFLLAALIMGYFGVDALAAHQIAMQCASMAYAIPIGLSMATALQVGHAMGAKDIDQAQRWAFLGMGLGLILTACIACIFIFIPDKLIHLFITSNQTNYQVVSELAASFLIMAAIFQCFDGAQAIAIGALRGLKDTFVPMLLSIGCYWFLGVGSAYYFAFHLHQGPLGVWYGLSFGLCSIGIILLIRLWYKLKDERKKMLASPANF